MPKRTKIQGLTTSAIAWQISTILPRYKRSFILCNDEAEAERILQDLQFFAGSDLPLTPFPAWDTLPFEMVSPAREISAQRNNTALSLQKRHSYCVVASLAALLQKSPHPEKLSSLERELQRNDTVDRKELLTHLEYCGFKRVTLVESIGEFAVRGGIIDLFPATSHHPVRLDFFDDEIDAIKLFDARTQRSIKSVETCHIIPVGEYVPFYSDDSLLAPAIENVKQRAIECETPPREVQASITNIRTGMLVPGIEQLSAIAGRDNCSLLESLQADTHCFFVNEFALEQALTLHTEEIQERYQRLLESQHLVPEKSHFFLDKEELLQRLAHFDQTIFGSNSITVFSSEDDPHTQISSTEHQLLRHSIQSSLGSGSAFKVLQDQVADWHAAEYAVAIVVGAPSRAERLIQILTDLDIPARLTKASFEEWKSFKAGKVVSILIGHLEAGFVCSTANLVLLSEYELFAKKSYRKGVSARKDLKKLLSSIGQLTVEDFVVHEDFGIGQYKGLTHKAIEGNEGDFLHIVYADSTLYLPAHNIGKIQKYVSSEGAPPALDKLSSQKWQKTKAKVREAVSTLAGELISLYAARKQARGFAFEADTKEEQLFADLFPFDETVDQLQAIEETLTDMAKDQPMDRLICGDVGFGKTEVALRAAFRCVQAGKQVAILVPTTILVEQHKNSFLERFRSYPIQVKALSRFYKAKENAQTMASIAAGNTDIVVGTHKLLSKNLSFHNLGLLIIDEEHRFGVKQKEQLKQFKKQVDVLTLTATPIPRTLHMAMLQIRDISVITTPPNDRRVIKTYIAQRDDALVRDALIREFQRGGQSFFLHNRVQSIASITGGLQNLCPEMRFEFAHGQMTEVQLEKIMRRFIQKEIDVLVCTTIVESGIDVPNANTMIIDRADMFGLAQLYQIRGRVGRSTKQAYCYFLVPPMQKLGSEAQLRLKALQALDDLGQGFQLAMRDLEIRGAGNLLGKQQSGNVLAVGYDMYTRILNEAISTLDNSYEEPLLSIEPDIRIAKNAFLPEVYIPDISERLILYQRLTALQSLEAAAELRAEIEDRFGEFGKEVENLLQVMTIRILCKKSAIVQLEKIRERLLVTFAPQATIAVDRLIALVKTYPKRYRLTSNNALSIAWEPNFEDLSLLRQYLTELLQRIMDT